MRRKYKVFISSSFGDLEKHRLRLLLKTLKLGHIPSGMELFQPGEPQNLKIIEDEIASSDIFVILVGARLGTSVTGTNPLTYTMREYELAKKYRLPIIPLLLNHEEYEAERHSIVKNCKEQEEKQKAKEQETILDKLRDDVQQREDGGKRIAGFFSYLNIDQLCDTYADALHGEVERLTENGAKGGWVEGKYYDDLNARIVLGASVSNPFFQRYANRLSTFEKLAQRTLVEAAAKETIAEYFWEQYMPRFDENHISHIYFESGSSIAYVSRKFIEYVKEEVWFAKHALDKRLKLRTNNLFTYMDFLLLDPPWSPMDIQLLPHGFISHDYGATYGELKSARKKQSPSKPIPGYKLADDACTEVKKLTRKLASTFTKEAGIVLMTASGVDIDPDSPFPGPHVGSYYNMLVKRCLFSLSCPKVLFLDERKWGYKFGLGFCHSVCDSEYTWEDLKTKSPIAVALAAKDEVTLDTLCQSLADNGFSHQERGDTKSRTAGLWPVIAANDLFAAKFK
ncbi:MAG TPA: DUF4062 domain-containing protein [Pyrinomonadaceae bacterium]|nr:DUF4062 domain-containing protein [Pyrinomonadaceae bacterium]